LEKKKLDLGELHKEIETACGSRLEEDDVAIETSEPDVLETLDNWI